MHRQGLDFLDEAEISYHRPFAQTPEWSVLMKVGVSKGQSPKGALEDLFESAGDLVLDGVIASAG